MVCAHHKPQEVESGNKGHFVNRIIRRIQDNLKRLSYIQDENGKFKGGIHETRSIEVTTHSVEEGHPAPVGNNYAW
jgi:hypothetical protein